MLDGQEVHKKVLIGFKPSPHPAPHHVLIIKGRQQRVFVGKCLSVCHKVIFMEVMTSWQERSS